MQSLVSARIPIRISARPAGSSQINLHRLPVCTEGGGDVTRKRYSELGLSTTEADDLIKSGYAIYDGDVVIDRYYGAALSSIDGRTRFRADLFLNALKEGKCHVPIVSVSSTAEAHRQIDLWQSKHTRSLLFRGQTCSYPLKRKHNNPFFQFESFGEISLVPSLWRQLLKVRPDRYPTFTGLGRHDWKAVIDDQFDLEDIARRCDAERSAGGSINSFQDMEDSDDPVLHEYGRTHMDLLVGYDFTQPVRLNTLLQHYGLLSPLLDLTTDTDVALYFASHKADRIDGKYRYSFVGNNNRQSVLYVFAQHNVEMLPHEHARVMNRIHALRPMRQSCVVSLGGFLALNLPADFLVGILKLDYEHEGTVKYSTVDLFPPESEDAFLSALLRKLPHPEFVSQTY